MRRQAPVDYASPNFHPPWLKRHFSAQLRVLGAAARRRQTGENSASAIDGLLQLAKSWNVAISSHLCRVQWIIQRLMDNRWGWAVRNAQRLQLLTAIIPNMLLDFIKKTQQTQQLFHKTRHLPPVCSPLSPGWRKTPPLKTPLLNAPLKVASQSHVYLLVLETPRTNSFFNFLLSSRRCIHWSTTCNQVLLVSLQLGRRNAWEGQRG